MPSPASLSASSDPVASGSPTASSASLRALAIGMGWLPEQPGNGLDRVYYSLSRHLPSAGVQVSGLVTGPPGVEPSSGRTVKSFAQPDASLFSRLRSVRKMVRAELQATEVDLVASHFALYTAPALDLLGSRPLVVHFHGPWALESGVEGESAVKTGAKALLERLVYKRATRFIVLSESFRDTLSQTYNVPRERIRIVPGGVEVDRFDTPYAPEEARERLGWPCDRPIILSVRRLARRMGLENLIAAVQHIRQHVPEVLLHIAGKGPLYEELATLIESTGLQDHVRLLGFVPDEDLPLAYRAADVSIVPTVQLEGFGLITLESLAAGTPVLVTPVGGLPETVRDLSEELILPDSGTESLAAALSDALLETSSLPSAEACQQYVRNRYSWPIIARKTRAVYEDAL